MPEWRALVDAIEIDPCYDGQIFGPQIVDAPAGRRTQVQGEYRIPGFPDATTVAVRITDIWGGETLLAQVC